MADPREEGRGGEEVRLRVSEPADRLDRYLADRLEGVSRTRVKALIQGGEVRVDGKTTRPSARLVGGEEVQVHLPPPEPTHLEPEPLPLSIVHLDADLLVVDKEPGMVVHPAPGHRTGTLVHALLHAVPDVGAVGGEARPGIVHRLDKGTSGLLVVARNDAAMRGLQERFARHDVERVYLAVVHGRPAGDTGCRVSRLGRDSRNRQRFTSVERGGKRAVTHWRLLAHGNGTSLLSCRLETGRTHQIRVHLSEMGCPVVGDSLYGWRKPHLPAPLAPWSSRLTHPLLHAATLGFVHPVRGEPCVFYACPPPDFRAFCVDAGLDLPSPGEIPRPG